MKSFLQIYESSEPTQAQLLAGNYKKRKVHWNGLTISIENDAGSYREGTDQDGKKWRTKIHYDYGYINGTESKDGDQIDIFIGPDLDSEIVFVINQIDQKSGNFDEHKVIIGANSKEEAEKIYLKNYEKGWKTGEIVGLHIDSFKEWINSKEKLTKPTKVKVESMKFKELLELNEKSKWNVVYEKLIKDLMKLSWDSKPKRTKQSSINELEGMIKGTIVSFSWHEPDQRGNSWKFLGLIVGREPGKFVKTQEKFNRTWIDVIDSRAEEKTIEANVKEFMDAVDYVKKM